MIFNPSGEVDLLVHNSHDPAYNLACEEYYLCQSERNIIMLWRNAPSVIIGRNQNAYAELDMQYIAEHHIPVIRRLTGGGAVYHDLSNLNYTFITAGSGGFAAFAPFLEPVAAYLRSLGLSAELSGRNDILVDGFKVSGNAQAHHKNRSLIHGTLLFDVKLESLTRALKPHPMKLSNKGIASVASRVANIKNLLPEPMTIDEFIAGLKNWFGGISQCVPKEITASENAAIQKLADEKYSTWTWNIGHAPAFSADASGYFAGVGSVSVHFDVRDGIITGLKIYGDFFGSGEIAQLESCLTGVRHEEDALMQAAEQAGLERYINGVSAGEFIRLFFA
ncbi:MAG TPA: lipoate--protein ligase [Clostridiales bacterium]|nr:MAG: Lipoate-protein ligase LplJ [Firmicutes bacterium ADurb.Bin262]HOU10978.1 lipoate--protein ligase [Clostridiales bacterium]HQH62316.1 lipoate--protein ligase [Clostridiales bacterium]HQK73707.1 lipoate--protein ligase [Clostridiales bacterium]